MSVCVIRQTYFRLEEGTRNLSRLLVIIVLLLVCVGSTFHILSNKLNGGAAIFVLPFSMLAFIFYGYSFIFPKYFVVEADSEVLRWGFAGVGEMSKLKWEDVVGFEQDNDSTYVVYAICKNGRIVRLPEELMLSEEAKHALGKFPRIGDLFITRKSAAGVIA